MVRSLRMSLHISILVVVLADVLHAEDVMKMEVDATEITRHLLHTRLEIPTRPGTQVLWYPKWIPGVHGPKGPVHNLGGFAVKTSDGERITWRRNSLEPYRFECDVPDGVEAIVVNIDYICNQPSDLSKGADVQSSGVLATVSWNACLVYPEGIANNELQIDLKAKIPDGWHFKTALTAKGTADQWIEFEQATLETIVDSPMICGKYFYTHRLSEDPPVFLHLASETPSAGRFDEDKEFMEGMRSMVREVAALMGLPPFEEYHFLTISSNRLRSSGVEHRASSLNIFDETDMTSKCERLGWNAEWLPHEYIHAWCGKTRRPAGMITRNYHDPKDLRLLWVYEGPAEYLGQVVAVRCGIHRRSEYPERLAYLVRELSMQHGRRWRSLEDTAVTAYQLRNRSPHWNYLRRQQDYYGEGALYWMEADAIIRQESGGKSSLDDFCRHFFESTPAGATSDFQEDELYAALGDLVEYDWESFFTDRVGRPADSLPLTVIPRIGYSVAQSPSPSKFLETVDTRNGECDQTASVGLKVDQSGRILGVIPGSTADDAGLCRDMTIRGTNGWIFGVARLRDAIADSKSRSSVELLVQDRDHLRAVAISYSEGSRYFHLELDRTRPNMLGDILRPRVGPVCRSIELKP